MDYSIPLPLEHKLVTKFGFRIERRVFNERIIFVKDKPQKKVFIMGSPPTKMTKEAERKLFARCESIVDYYPVPMSAVPAIRQRLHNLAQSLPRLEQEFVLDFIQANFPEPEKVKA